MCVCPRSSSAFYFQAQRHCDKVNKVFADVLDCCGEGLSSVESVLTGTRTIVDDEGTGSGGMKSRHSKMGTIVIGYRGYSLSSFALVVLTFQYPRVTFDTKGWLVVEGNGGEVATGGE